MPTGAIAATGSVLERGDGAGVEVFTAIAEVRRASLSGLSTNLVESTGIETPGSFRTYFATFRDGGSVSFLLNYLPASAGHAAVIADWKNGVVRNFRLKLGSIPAATIAFAAVISAIDITAESESPLAVNVSLKITGEPIWS